MLKSAPQKILISKNLFFKSGKTQSLCFRIEALKNLRTALLDSQRPLIDALHQDMKKPPHEALESEIRICLDEIYLHIRMLCRWKQPQSVKTPLIFWPSMSFITPEPYGVALIISAWNFPIALSLMPLIGAISAGNCAVIKPSELAPACANVLEKIILSTFEPCYVNVIKGDASTAQELLAMPFNFIFFTGSTRVGKLVMKAAAENLTPLTLELGGCNPCIVDKDCDIKVAARRIIWGKFYNAGQSCLAPNYLLVHEDIKESLVQEIKLLIHAWYDQDKKTMSSIINATHFQRLLNLLNNKQIISGGNFNRENLYLEPTIVETDFNDSIIHEEIFGPVLPIITYKELDTIIHTLAHNPKPLACYFFSSNKKLQDKIIDSIQAGSICLNDAVVQYANLHLPFGGIGASGFGAYHGKKSFDIFTHYKSIMKRSFFFDWKWRYFS